MKIVRVDIPQSEAAEVGLAELQFPRLADIVVLAGPNGGGKSRILNLVRKYIEEAKIRVDHRRKLAAGIDRHKRMIEQRVVMGDTDSQDLTNLRQELSRLERLRRHLDEIQVDDESHAIRVVDLVPRNLELQDPGNLSRNKLRDHAQRAERTPANTMNQDALAYIQFKQEQHYEVTHQKYAGSLDEKKAIEKAYESLEKLVRDLLRTDLTRNSDGFACIFGKPVGESMLSEGQRVLMQLLVAVHPTRRDEELLLFMDEPENHLHPSSLIDVFDRIRVAFPKAQVWIATHSIPLIAHLHAEPQCVIYFVDQGTTRLANTKPNLILDGLIGDESERIKLLNFVDLPYTLAATTFASECLFTPGVAEFQQRDPQLAQIQAVISMLGNEGGPVRILDYGAGKGRLVASLRDAIKNSSGKIEYWAFDADLRNRSACESEIQLVYGPETTCRWFSNHDQLRAAAGDKSFAVVVMCNTLHEIDPRMWLDLIGPNGTLSHLLMPTGFLLLVEDMRIPHGELPHPSGFFLLDTLHIQQLFCATTADDVRAILVRDQRGDGRLKAHLIPEKYVLRASKESRNRAIDALARTAMAQMREIRSRHAGSYKEGQDHALWSQMFANCHLFADQ
jgi:energy-coupling factor transporter ATP-binding protein EcfA2